MRRPFESALAAAVRAVDQSMSGLLPPDGRESISVVAHRSGVTPNLLFRWRRPFREHFRTIIMVSVLFTAGGFNPPVASLSTVFLAPDIQEAILEGRQAKGIQLEELTRAMPAEWGEQGRLVDQLLL